MGWQGQSTVFTSCGDDEDIPTDKIAASDKGTFTDLRDGNIYTWVRYGNLDWFAENFRYDLQDETQCRLYVMEDNVTKLDAKKYGRIYTYQGAVEACPDGWRLPTDEDWKNLEMQMGMSAADTDGMEWRGNIANRMMTKYGETPDINILLTGYYSPNIVMGKTGYKFFSTKGYYWTATSDTDKGSGFYFFREFMYNNAGVRRMSTTDYFYMSVRYVRDAQ